MPVRRADLACRRPASGRPAPLGAGPDDGLGLGMLVGIVVLLAVGAGVLAFFLLRDRGQHTAVTTTVVVRGGAARAGNAPASTGVPLPTVVGVRLPLATSTLRNAGFAVRDRVVRGPAPAGLVLAERPRGNQSVAAKTLVTLTISNGAATAALPMSTAATSRITTTSPATTTQPAATTNSPATSSSSATTGTAPTTIAAPPAAAAVPSVTGDTVGAGAQALSRAGFLVSLAYVPGTSTLGTVAAESPDSGASAPSGSHVTINASSGPGQNPPETVPDVTGRTIPQAVSTLQRAGLRLIFLKKQVTDRSLAGTVVEQTPAPGAKAPKNAQVLVYMGAYS